MKNVLSLNFVLTLQGGSISAETIATELSIPIGQLKRKISFWVNKGVLLEKAEISSRNTKSSLSGSPNNILYTTAKILKLRGSKSNLGERMEWDDNDGHHHTTIINEQDQDNSFSIVSTNSDPLPQVIQILPLIIS
jgi:hypothetical protein